MIPEQTIDQVRQATDIVQIIGEYLKLKKRGRNHIALCPFHTEKTPSFSVSEDKQIYHCFGCSKGGNVFSFLMEHEKMTFVEAVRHLAARAGITIQEERQSSGMREQLERLNFAHQVALEYFGKTLNLPKYRQVLDDYLRGRRGIKDETIEYFGIGLAGQEWDGLIRYAGSKDITPEDLVTAGLALKSEKKGNYFDRFRQRLMIPIFNLSGHPIAFGGRTLAKGESAKYINSPETPLYSKSNLLYGLNLARDHIRKANEAIVVEGYFDVISLWQAGIKNVVASSGTAFTSQQARLLGRFAEMVYLFFDADSAGQKAAIRSVDTLYDAGVEVRVMVAPQEEDPDSVAAGGGGEAIQLLKDKAMDFIPFRLRDVDLAETGIIGKEKLIKELAGISSRIGDKTRRGLFQQQAAAALHVDVEMIQLPATSTRSSEPAPSEGTPSRRFDPIEFELLAVLFCSPGTIDTIFNRISPEDFDSRELSRLYAAMINQYRESGILSAAEMIEHVEDPSFQSLITEVASKDYPADEIDPGAAAILERMTENKRKRRRLKLKKDLEQAVAAGDDEKAISIQKEIQDLL